MIFRFKEPSSPVYDIDQAVSGTIPAAHTFIIRHDNAGIEIINQEMDAREYKLSLSLLKFERPVSLQAISPGGDLLTLFFMLDGASTYVSGRQAYMLPRLCNYALLGMDKAPHFRVKFEEGHYRFLQVVIPRKLVSHIISRIYPLQQDMVSWQIEHGWELPLSEYANRQILNILNCKYTGERAIIYLNQICRSLLREYIQQLGLRHEDIVNRQQWTKERCIGKVSNVNNIKSDNSLPGSDTLFMKWQLPAADVHIEMQKSFRALFQKINLSGLLLRINHLLVEKNAEQFIYTKEKVFSLVCLYKANSVSCLDEDGPPLGTGEYHLFYLNDKLRQWELQRGEYLFVNIDISPKLLAEYCEYLPDSVNMMFLLSRFMSSVETTAALKFNKVVRDIIGKILNCKYSGEIAMAYLRPLCYQLIRHFFQQYMLEINPTNYIVPMSKDRKDLLGIFLNRINKLPVRCLDVKSIAKKYDINERTLDKLLWENYQVSMSGFIYRRRIEEVFKKLAKADPRTEIDLYRMARRCGYTSVGALKTAFADYYDSELCDLFRNVKMTYGLLPWGRKLILRFRDAISPIILIIYSMILDRLKKVYSNEYRIVE